jgi:hypothetical protein
MNLDQDIRTYFDRLAEQTEVPVRRRRDGSAVVAAKRATVGVTLAGLVLVGIVTIVPRTLFGGGLGDTASVIAPPTASLPPFHYVPPTGPACPAAAIEAKSVSADAIGIPPRPAVGRRRTEPPGIEAFELVNVSHERCLLPWTPKVSIRTADGQTVSVHYADLPDGPTRQAVEPGGHADFIVDYDQAANHCPSGATTEVEQVTFHLLSGAARTVPSPDWRLRAACSLRVVATGGVGTSIGNAQLHTHLHISVKR